MEQAGSVFKSKFLFSPRRPVVDAFSGSGSGSGFSLSWSWSCFPIFDSILRFCFYLSGGGCIFVPLSLSCAPCVALALHFREFVRPFLHSFGHGKRRRIHGLDLGGIYLDSVWGVGDLL